MLRRAVGRLGWAVVPLAVLGWAVHLVLGVTSPPVSGPAAFTPDQAVFVLGQMVFVVVGALVVSRRGEIPIGWLFCAAGLVGVAQGLATRYAVHGLAGTTGWPAGGAAAWLSAVLWYPNNALLVLAGLLFPSGRPARAGRRRRDGAVLAGPGA